MRRSFIRAVVSAIRALVASTADLPPPVDLAKPDLADAEYGPHKLHRLDLWKAKSEQPTPIVVQIHGGGFYSGRKEDKISAATVNGLLRAGVSFMAINYRLTPEVRFPEHFMDCARAIQFARANAKAWNIDPKRIGATGNSAGGCAALWLAFHDDLADPKDADPVLRESTRLTCVSVGNAQSSVDPRVVKEWIGDTALQHRAFDGAFWGLKLEEMDTPKAHALFETSSPITHLTKDAPPVLAIYGAPPEGRDLTVSQAIHHINHGLRLKEQMDKLGIECTVLTSDDVKRGPDNGPVPFFVKHFGINPKK